MWYGPFHTALRSRVAHMVSAHHGTAFILVPLSDSQDRALTGIFYRQRPGRGPLTDTGSQTWSPESPHSSGREGPRASQSAGPPSLSPLVLAVPCRLCQRPRQGRAASACCAASWTSGMLPSGGPELPCGPGGADGPRGSGVHPLPCYATSACCTARQVRTGTGPAGACLPGLAGWCQPSG